MNPNQRSIAELKFRGRVCVVRNERMESWVAVTNRMARRPGEAPQRKSLVEIVYLREGRVQGSEEVERGEFQSQSFLTGRRYLPNPDAPGIYQLVG